MPLFSLLSGENFSAFLIIPLLMAGYILPLGYALGRLVWNEGPKIISGLGLGLAAVVSIWSWLAWLAVPVTPIIFLGVVGLITLVLFLFPAGQSPVSHKGLKVNKYYKVAQNFGLSSRRFAGRIPGVCNRQSNAEDSSKNQQDCNSYLFSVPKPGYLTAAVVLGVISYLFVSQSLIKIGVPAADAQLHGFIQMLIKQTKLFYPLSIYPQGAPLSNFYPPGFQIICVLNSQLTGINLPVTILGTTVAAYLILSLFLFEVLHKLTSRLWLPGLGVILIFSKGMQHLLASAQYPEIMAMIPCLGFIFFFSDFLKKNDWKNILLSGWLAGAAGLVHTRFLFWMVCALTVYLISRYGADPKPTGKEQLGLVLVIIISLAVNLPQWWLNAKSLAVSAGNLYEHPLVSAWELVKFQGRPFTVMMVLSIALNLFKRERLSVFLLTWISVMVIQMDYWRVIKFFSPSWFAIDYTTRPFGHFKDPFSFTNPWTALNYGLFPLIPLAGVWGISRSLLSGGWKKFAGRLVQYKPFFMAGLAILGIFYLHYEWSGLHLRRRETLPKEDFEVLTQLKRHTGFEDTFIFNPRDQLSGWAPVIAERRAMFFKSNYFFGPPPYLLPKKQINKVFLNLDRYYRFLKENRLNYIYVPSYWSSRFGRRKPPAFLKLEYQVDQAKIYRVL